MPSANEKLDCHVRVITPENVEFEYELAGPFQRLPAFLFDVAVRFAIFVGALFAGSLVLPWLPIGTALINVLAVLGFFLLSWFYGMFLETRYNGRTFGKMVFKLRAISVDGRPINASQSALRNFLRLADMNLLLSLQVFNAEAPPMFVIPTMLVGFASMTLTRRMQRLGDLAAGTMVVSEQRQRSPFNLRPEDVRAYGLAELIPVSFIPSVSLAQTIGLFMENRKRLNPIRRNDLARHLADPLIREFGLLPDTSPDLLLCALYVHIFLSEEQQSKGRERMRAMMSSRATTLPGKRAMARPPQAAGSVPTSAASKPLQADSPSDPRVAETSSAASGGNNSTANPQPSKPQNFNEND